MKRVLGLDMGTNSIGWALVEIDRVNKIVRIVGLGTRILPMDAGEISKFENEGALISLAAQRTQYRNARKQNQRFILRRDRLHLVLNLLKALPKHYALDIDFEKNGVKSGQFKENKEPKIAYSRKDKNSKYEFYFDDAFNEMIEDLQQVNPNIENKKGARIPKDWTLYYLRQKALKEKISLEELAWILLSYNQKRGYEKLEIEDKNEKENQLQEHLELRVESVIAKQDETGHYYEIQLNDNEKFTYKEYSNIQLTEVGDVKELHRTTTINEKGDIDKNKTTYSITDIYPLTIQKVNYTKIDSKSAPHQYEIIFSNGWKNIKTKKKYTSQYEKAIGKTFDYIVKTDFNSKFEIKKQQGKERTYREPDYSEKSNDWTLLKKKTEKEAILFNIKNGFINEKTKSAKNFISPYIYSILKDDAKTGNRTKIIGGMFQVVERKFYRDELNQIIETQRKEHKNSTLNDQNIFEDCVKLLYPNNKKHAKNLLKNKKAIQHLLIEDILLYQRDLKSKKSEIANCKYEVRHWEKSEKVDETTGEVKTEYTPHYHKVVAVSHPLFQEFRIWDKIHNLKIIQLEDKKQGQTRTNNDVTKTYLHTESDYQKLFNFFNNQKTINQRNFLKFCVDHLNLPKTGFVWNYPEEEELKGNETRVSFAYRFKRCGFVNYNEFLTQEKEIELWHYLYSINYKERNDNDKKSCKTFFTNFFNGYNIEQELLDKIVTDFSNYPKFDSKDGAYSEKVLKKLLPFMRKFGERFNGRFDFSDEITKHLNAIEYNPKNIFDYLKLDKESQQKRTKEQRIEVEQLKKELHQRLWEYKINNRIAEIIKKVKAIDFNAIEIDWSSITKVEVDERNGELAYPKGLFNTFRHVETVQDFVGLNLTQASYLVYGRHSELAKAKFWKTPEEIREGIRTELKQHSLNNPVAEKVIRETMQIVADIWEHFGKSAPNYFHKIHLEVGRELKKSATEKERSYAKQKENRKQNDRLRQILKEFLKEAQSTNRDHFERLKIVEDSVIHLSQYHSDFLYNQQKLKEKKITKSDIDNILKEPTITKAQFEKYKLWIEQGYVSPYTGKPIQLSNLFDGNLYNIDHIFPRASVTNNSLNNKVVCETNINTKKSDLTGREFILKYGGNNGILSDEDYVLLVKKQFSRNKQFILLAKEIPSGFTNSQLNNARHIARKAMGLLSHIVREPGEVEYRSKNVLPVTGRITSELKHAWRLNETWKELVSSRFIRLNELTQSELFGQYETNKNGHTYFNCKLNDEILKKNPNYDIKRLDHRHHALDALIVALCTEDHVAYINNVNAGINPKKKDRIEQVKTNRTRLKQRIKYKPNDENEKNKKDKDWRYLNPGDFHNNSSVVKVDFEFDEQKGFYKDIILNALGDIIVTFKRLKSPIRKTSNYYDSYYDENGVLRKDKQGNPLKRRTKQIDKNSNPNTSNKRNVAIRRNMHDEQPYGQTKLDFEILEIAKNLKSRDKILDDELKVQLEDLFVNCNNDLKQVEKLIKQGYLEDINGKAITHTAFRTNAQQKYKIRKKLSDLTNEKHIRKVADIRLQKDLFSHIKKFDNDYKAAFGSLGIEEFNKNRKIPVKKVTLFEGGSGRYVLGKKQSKKDHNKLVKGTNYCFVIDRKNNNYYTISLKQLIDDYYQNIDINEKIANETAEKFYLSAGELVYVPTDEEFNNPNKVKIDNIDKTRIYKFIKSSGVTANFIPFRISKVIYDYDKNKKEDKEMIKKLEKLSNSQMKIKSSKKGMVYLENEIGMTSHQNINTVDIKEYQSIKYRCWKLKTDRLGNIIYIMK